MDRLTTFVFDADVKEVVILSATIKLLTGLRRLDLEMCCFPWDAGSVSGEDEDEDFENDDGSDDEGEDDGGDGESGAGESENDGDGENVDNQGGEDDNGDESEEILDFGTGDGVEGGDLIALFGNERIAKRTEPVVILKTLWMWDLVGCSNEVVRAIFEKYPNIEQLHLPNICGTNDVDDLAKTIVALCPKLRTLQFYGEGRDTNIEFPFKVLEALPEQQVEQVCIRNFHIELDEQMARSVFLRHSATLHTLILQGCSLTDSAAIRTVLTEIKHLRLLVRINEPHTEPELSRPAYFRREAPVELSPIETRYFEPLEHFYRQIGKLTELRHLDLRMDKMGPNGERQSDIPTCSEVSFPGLLNIGMGRPGYLELLGGLSKLKQLCGSVFATTWLCAEQKKRQIELILVFRYERTDSMIERGWAFPP
ncbi:MAG: hypothetical protein JOS17DRAFT_786799 [Linnemannia elongata]|nr:MAG: hypothetical protein JOS17DRAFT_786799 [Linnemannia elongata]